MKRIENENRREFLTRRALFTGEFLKRNLKKKRTAFPPSQAFPRREFKKRVAFPPSLEPLKGPELKIGESLSSEKLQTRETYASVGGMRRSLEISKPNTRNPVAKTPKFQSNLLTSWAMLPAVWSPRGARRRSPVALSEAKSP